MDLPDDLVSHIVSFLSAKEAARLRIVSKKWLNLITIESDLVFEPEGDISARLRSFVEGLVAGFFSNRVTRFSLRLQYDDDDSRYKLVNDSLRNVIKRGVMDFELGINAAKHYSLPSQLFTCNTIVKMSLGSGFVIDIIPSNALLPALKTLLLESVQFNQLNGVDGCVFQSLLSACPVLEDLVIHGFNGELWNWSRTVSCQTLKRFTIRRKEEPEYHDDESATISFDLPSLVYLEYADVPQHRYPDVNLNSLVEAKLNFTQFRYYVDIQSDLTNLLKGLKYVQILRLDWFGDVIVLDEFSEALPVFENMSHLSLPIGKSSCWASVVALVEKSPNLKILTIRELHYSYANPKDFEYVCECLKEYSFLLSCPLEVLKITEFRGELGEMVQIRHILQNLQNLELLDVHVHASIDEEVQEIMEIIAMLPRASTKCQVKFS